MRIKPFLLSALLAAAVPTAAQNTPPSIETSAPFEEPEGLESKIVQCRNGHTFYFNFTKKDGIQVYLYNEARKLINETTLSGNDVWDAGDMKKSEIEGIYEINNQLVLFLEQLDSRQPRLYRIVLDVQTGKLISEKKIAEMSRYGAGAGYAMAFGHVDAKDFYVEKDPGSDCYAVVTYNSFSSETENRIHILHFNGQHQLLNEAAFSSPENKYKYTRYLGMTVDGDKQVYLGTYDFNTGSEKSSGVYFSRLKAGEKQMEHRMLSMTEDFKNTEAIMQYNAANKTIQLLTISEERSKSGFLSNTTPGYYKVLLTLVDPQSMVILFSKPLDVRLLNQQKRDILQQKGSYTGMPQDIVVHPDNTITLLLEEQQLWYSNRTGAGGMPVRADLLDIGVIHLDDKGNGKEGFIVQKIQQSRLAVPTFSMHERRKNAVIFDRGPIAFGSYANPGFYSYDYIATAKGSYLIFNDHPDNFNRKGKERVQNVVSISGTNTICYAEHNGDMTQSYLFGAPKDKKDHRFSLLSAANYLPEKQTYATLMIEQEGRKKMARIAWVKLD